MRMRPCVQRSPGNGRLGTRVRVWRPSWTGPAQTRGLSLRVVEADWIGLVAQHHVHEPHDAHRKPCHAGMLAPASTKNFRKCDCQRSVTENGNSSILADSPSNVEVANGIFNAAIYCR